MLPAGVRMRILIYLGVLLVLLGFGSPGGGLIGLPISFLLKNKLHLKAHEMAIFGLIAGGAGLRVLPLRICARHLESVRHAGPRLHGAVRRPVRGRLRASSPSRP